MSWRVRFTEEAERDLLALYEFLATGDLDAAEAALGQIKKALVLLESFPFSCRKADGAGGNPRLREMVVGFGRSGYVVLFEIDSAEWVTVLAVRHQRESDFH